MPKKEAVPAFTPLAVVGIGGVFPKAGTIKQFWANIKNKVDAIQDVPATHWSKDDYFDATKKGVDTVYACKGGFLDQYDFDPSEFGLAPNTLEATDPAQLFGLVAAKMALADAGYPVDKDTWDRSRVSTILGVTGTLEIVIPLGARLSHPQWRKALDEAGVPKAQAEDVVARMADSYVPWQEASFPGLLGNVVSGRIANRFNLGGTNCTVDAACGSSLSAIHMASLELQTGRAKMVVTGGVDTFNDIFMYTCFTKTPALSPGGHAKPFDAKADGTTLGEGIGMVVLKRLDDAVAEGDRVIAVLRGIGSSSDGRGKSIYAPSAGGQTRALEEAYRVAGVAPETIELVEAHGTGTAVGDGIEVEALAGVYKKDAKRSGGWCALGSVKSMVGHTKAAAGAAAFVKAAMALRHKTFPPTLKVTEPHPVLAKGDTPFYLSLEKRPWMAPEGHPRRAACSALGFGGTNFHAVLEEASGAKTETDWDGEHELFAGMDVAPLLAAKNWDEVRLACHASRMTFDPAAPKRLLLVLERGGDWKAVAEKAKGLKASPLEGIFYGEGKPGKLAVLFPGQGSQYVGMSRDLVCAFPEAFDALAEADAAYDDGRLSDVLFPRPTLKAEEKDAQEKALRDTSVAQPALGAAALSAWRVLSRFGVKADAAAGHSYGELVALHVAGRYDAETLHTLSRLRGKLMKGDGSDKGSMLAVVTTLDALAAFINEEKLDLVIANRNAPNQNVLSGKTSEIEKAEKLLTGKGVKAIRLPVAAAFHSALVEPALKPFGAALEKVAFSKPSLPVYANSTGTPYPDAPKASRELLAGQLGKPVEFVKLVSNMAADGVTTIVECGAGGRLTGLVNQIAPSVNAVAVDASNGKKNGIADLAKALAQLAALGHVVDLRDWQGGDSGVKDARPKPKLSVALTGATYRSTPKKQFEKKLTKGPGTDLTFPPATSPTAMTSTDPTLLGQALAAAQASIDALNRLQEQTASLHLQFLQSQEASQRHIQNLVEQQQAVVARLSGGAPMPVPVYVPPPAPVVVAEVIPKTPQRSSVDKSVSTQDVLPVLLGIVSEKTGYPAETLNADMDLEADLGIDSIKRVEILSAVREKLPGAPQVKPEHLGTLRTLRSIADYLSQGLESSASIQIETRGSTVSGHSQPTATAQPAAVLPVLLAIVADKTGYPADTLNPDMDLEADLGIDSIKRVEILSTVRERAPGLPEVDTARMATLRTLTEIIEFLGGAGASTSRTPAVTKANGVAPAASAGVDLVPLMLAIVAEKTGYPAEMIELTMDLEADLGIDSIKRVEILSTVRERAPGLPEVDTARMATLRTLNEIIEFLGGSGASKKNANGAAPVKAAHAASGNGAVVPAKQRAGIGRFVVHAVPTAVQGLATPGLLGSASVAVTADGAGTDAELVKELRRRGVTAVAVAGNAIPADAKAVIFLGGLRAIGGIDDALAVNREGFAVASSIAARFREKGGTLVTVQDTGGDFGLSGRSEARAWLAGLGALAKTAAQEWPSGFTRAIDIERGSRNASALAVALADELLAGGVEREVGLRATGERTVIGATNTPVDASGHAVEKGAVFVVSGGGRGVTASALLELARTAKPRFVLLGRTPLGDEPAAFAGIRGDAELKRVALAEAKRLGAPTSPKDLAKTVDQLTASREIRETLRLLVEAGSEARYAAADVRDAKSLAPVLEDVRRTWGPIRGLVHGAGVLSDAFLDKKTAEQFDRVFDTKILGLRALLDATKADPLEWICLFSSVAARGGNAGQADYAMANEVLNKVAAVEAHRRKTCRVVAIGWGPWEGGMVTPALKKHFEALGVPLLPIAGGAQAFVRELSGTGHNEVVIAGGTSLSAGEPKLQAAVFVDRKTYPQLESHRIKGKVVLPVVIALEWFARLVEPLCGDRAVMEFRDLRVVRGVTLEGFDGAGDHFLIVAEPQQGGDVALSLRDAKGATRYAATLDLLSPEGARTSHTEPVKAAAPDVFGTLYGPSALFHGPDFQVLRGIDGFSGDRAKAALTGTDSMGWPTGGWNTDPAALDGTLQLAMLFGLHGGKGARLPMKIGRVRHHRQRGNGNGNGNGHGPRALRCELSHRDSSKERSIFDLSLVLPDGTNVADLIGVEMFAVPSGSTAN